MDALVAMKFSTNSFVDVPLVTTELVNWALMIELLDNTDDDATTELV